MYRLCINKQDEWYKQTPILRSQMRQDMQRLNSGLQYPLDDCKLLRYTKLLTASLLPSIDMLTGAGPETKFGSLVLDDGAEASLKLKLIFCIQDLWSLASRSNCNSGVCWHMSHYLPRLQYVAKLPCEIRKSKIVTEFLHWTWQLICLTKI